jgi:glycosyltransferase involved in cell wall biosynthesis
MAARCSDAELVQNPEDLPVLERLGVPEHKLHLLGNGVDLNRFDPDRADLPGPAEMRASLGIGPDEVVCGAVGRLVREKGLPELFEAAALVSHEHPRFSLVVVGPDDPDKADAVTPEEQTAARRAGVRFLGRRHDVEALYRAMDFYVLASHREGFPRSAMEAAAMGLPIVATDIRGCRQVVEDGHTGLLVPTRSVDGLARALSRLVADAGLRRTMGAAARIKARAEFDDRRVIDVTLGVYEKLLQTAGRKGTVAR